MISNKELAKVVDMLNKKANLMRIKIAGRTLFGFGNVLEDQEGTETIILTATFIKSEGYAMLETIKKWRG